VYLIPADVCFIRQETLEDSLKQNKFSFKDLHKQQHNKYFVNVETCVHNIYWYYYKVTRNFKKKL